MTGLRPLDGLKGYPAQLEPGLRCILAVQDLTPAQAWKELVSDLTRELRAKSPSGTANPENLISAQLLPTLRKLGLAIGKHREFRLTYWGKAVAQSVRNAESFKIRLAAAIIRADEQRWHIVQALRNSREYPGQQVTLASLAVSLARLGVDACQDFRDLDTATHQELTSLGVSTGRSRSRLTETLRFFDYSDVARRSLGTVTLLDSTIERAATAVDGVINPAIRTEQFFQTLAETYTSLSRRVGSPYVPIINVREAVCERLRIDDERFTELLLEGVPRHGNYRILLSPPSGSVPSWKLVRRGPSRFYYLSIYGAKEGSASS